VYERLTTRRDKWAADRGGQVTVTEAIERLLDIADENDLAELERARAAAAITEWAGPTP